MSKAVIDKKGIVSKNKRHETDTGSPEVQIALITERINGLTEHFKTHAKDFAARRGLLMMVGQRRRLLKYLGRVNAPVYKTLIEKLGIRK